MSARFLERVKSYFLEFQITLIVFCYGIIVLCVTFSWEKIIFPRYRYCYIEV